MNVDRGARHENMPLLVKQRNDVRWLCLNRPARRNAINPDLLEALEAALRDASQDPSTVVIVISGAGPSFCAGADLQYLHAIAAKGGSPMAFLEQISDCFTHIAQVPKPTVAAVHGHVVAGGLELALACDAVVTRSGTLIGDGHVRNGLLPAGGASLRLLRKVGEPLASWLMLTGELLSVEQFLPCGLVRAVAPPAHFDRMVDDTVRQLRDASGDAQSRIKRLLAEVPDMATDEALAHELETFADHWGSPDTVRGLSRFLTRQRGIS